MSSSSSDDDDDNDKDEDDDDDKDEDDDDKEGTTTVTILAIENRKLHRQLEFCQNQIEVLSAELRSYKRGQRKTKRQIRTDNKWNGEDANISDKVSNWVKTHLFQQYKFLTSNWMEYNSKKETSLSSYTRNKLKIESDNYKDLWDRVICPTINTKYTTIRSNLSIDIRKAYRSKYLNLLFLSTHIMTNLFICSDNRRSK